MSKSSKHLITRPGTPHTACAGLATLRSARPCRRRYEVSIVRLILITLFFIVASCSSDYDQRNLVVSPSGDRLFQYELFLPKSDGKMPLAVFSHGSGGDYNNYSWLIKELTTNGYVVAALNHPFNNARNNTDEGVIRVWDRPNDISLLIDTLLADPELSAHIDPNRISAVGHSSGGYTTIALGGAIYNPDLMIAYCSGSERGPDCDLANDEVTIDYSTASLSYKDARVKSVVAMAPAVGPAIDKASLNLINIPVLIIATEDDEILDINKHAKRYAKHIPGSELQLLAGGGHFVYMECNIIIKIVNLFIDNLDLCGSKFSVNRESARKNAASIIIDFLDTNIGEIPHNKLSKRDALDGAPS